MLVGKDAGNFGVSKAAMKAILCTSQGCSKSFIPTLVSQKKAMKILDSFVHGLYEQLAVEASRVARSHRRKSLTSRDIETSVRVLLPEGLARRAMDKANQAVANLSN